MRRYLMFSALLLCSFVDVSVHGLAPTPAPTCSFLSVEMATSLYGAPVSLGDSAKGAGSGMTLCLFVNAKKSEAVSILVQDMPRGMESTLMDAVAKGDSKNRVIPVAGLGERAMFKIDPADVSLVAFIHGKMVVLGINGTDTPARRTGLTSVMREIVGRL